MKSHPKSNRTASPLQHLSRTGAHAVKKTVSKSMVTLGDLISAAYEVTGSGDAAALLLSPLSPLSRMLGRRIVIAA
jgi:hypothetical protein